jgi:hypothetical protein
MWWSGVRAFTEWNRRIVYSFPLTQNGYGPRPSAVVLHAGNLYGTTFDGGIYQVGTVFQLAPNSDGTWTEQDLYDFEDGFDGGYVGGGVVFDSAGNMYGETMDGGSFACPQSGCGVIFELTQQPNGTWNDKTIYTFHGLNGSKGSQPYGGLTLDSAGNLYGVTNSGGTGTCAGVSYPCGTIFKLSLSDPETTFKIIGSFNGIDGANPSCGVIVDVSGNIYGTDQAGGDLKCTSGDGYGCGTIFEVTP